MHLNCYRIVKEKFKDDFSGEGGLFAPGRWHRKGNKIIYTSCHRSTAKLETLQNTASSQVPKGRWMLTIEIDETVSIKVLDVNQLPRGWDNNPHSYISQDIGDSWLKSLETAILKVPSSQDHMVWNMLINPKHPDVLNAKVRVIEKEKINFDERLRP